MDEEGEVLERLARNWWLVALRGVAAVVFGLLALIWPGLTLAVLVLLFGAYALVDGVAELISAARGRVRGGDRGWLVVEGVVGVGAGVVALLWPGVTALALVVVIGVWAVVTGVMEVAAAVVLRRRLRNERWLALTGVLSVVLGVILLVNPGAGAVALAWLIGAYALVFGVSLVALGFRVRGYRDFSGLQPPRTPGPRPA